MGAGQSSLQDPAESSSSTTVAESRSPSSSRSRSPSPRSPSRSARRRSSSTDSRASARWTPSTAVRFDLSFKGDRIDSTNPRAFVSEYACLHEHLELGTQFMPGDLLEFSLGNLRLFDKEVAHWAVYVGARDNFLAVMQFWPESANHLPPCWYKSLPFVQDYRELKHGKIGGWFLYRLFAEKGARSDTPFRINNELDNSHEPFSADEIVERAEADYGTGGYNLFTNNCEHYVNRCRYGVSRSVQIEKMPRPIRPSATATPSKEK